MGTFGEKLKDCMERERIVKQWVKRFERLTKAGGTRADFCANRNVDQGQLTRWLVGKNLPEWDSIKRIESAMEKEGI